MPTQPTTSEHDPNTASGTHHYILTLQAPAPGGLRVDTFSSTATPHAGCTRAEAYRAIYDSVVQAHPALAGGSTVFFSLEPNTI
jgi:hypothetical protein